MFINMVFITALLSVICTVTLTLVGFIFKAIITQGAALSLLVQRVGALNYEVVDKRLLELEGDMARSWARWEEQDKIMRTNQYNR